MIQCTHHRTRCDCSWTRTKCSTSFENETAYLLVSKKISSKKRPTAHCNRMLMLIPLKTYSHHSLIHSHSLTHPHYIKFAHSFFMQYAAAAATWTMDFEFLSTCRTFCFGLVLVSLFFPLINSIMNEIIGNDSRFAKNKDKK